VRIEDGDRVVAIGFDAEFGTITTYISMRPSSEIWLHMADPKLLARIDDLVVLHQRTMNRACLINPVPDPEL
jgi:hypothetical protein